MTDTSCHQYQPWAGQALRVLLRHLPTGPAWDAYRITGKTANLLWSGISQAFTDASVALCALALELNPYTTNELISDWERAVSLPDPCLPRVDTIEQRRAWVVWRLKKKRWTTARDWHDLASLFGLTISIVPGWYVQQPALFDACLDSYFFDFPKRGRFRVYIDITSGCGEAGFDYTNDYAFPTTSSACQTFMCLINRVKPANVVVVWNADPVGNGWLTCGSSGKVL